MQTTHKKRNIIKYNEEGVSLIMIDTQALAIISNKHIVFIH